MASLVLVTSNDLGRFDLTSHTLHTYNTSAAFSFSFIQPSHFSETAPGQAASKEGTD